MGLPKLKAKMNVEVYLEGERISPVRREFIEGELYEMDASGVDHNFIVGDLYAFLLNHLRDSDYHLFFHDIKVRVSKEHFYYPDIFVSCKEKPESPYFRDNPILIVEVTSSSTEQIDRREKLIFYRRMPSLHEYVIIDQYKMSVEAHRKQSDGKWITYYFDESSTTVDLTTINLSIPLPDLYRRVQFQKNASPEN